MSVTDATARPHDQLRDLAAHVDHQLENLDRCCFRLRTELAGEEDPSKIRDAARRLASHAAAVSSLTTAIRELATGIAKAN